MSRILYQFKITVVNDTVYYNHITKTYCAGSSVYCPKCREFVGRYLLYSISEITCDYCNHTWIEKVKFYPTCYPYYFSCPKCNSHIGTNFNEQEGDILEITCDKCNHIWIDKFKLS